MTPERLATVLQIIRWSGVTLAKAVDVRTSVVNRWLSGLEPVPRKVGGWVEALCFVHEAAENAKPPTAGEGYDDTETAHEHVPLYSYHLLRALREDAIKLRQLFGTEDEAAVFFLLSRGLANREGEDLVITPKGRAIGSVML
jgi:hypothetical protein